MPIVWMPLRSVWAGIVYRITHRVSMAKGVCFGAGKPLIAVPTLQALALSVSERIREEALYCPMIDARRMEVYTAFFDRNNQQVIDTKAEIVDENSFADLLAGHKIYFFGNGSDKVRMLLTAPNAHFMGQVETSARHMIPPCRGAVRPARICRCRLLRTVLSQRFYCHDSEEKSDLIQFSPAYRVLNFSIIFFIKI